MRSGGLKLLIGYLVTLGVFITISFSILAFSAHEAPSAGQDADLQSKVARLEQVIESWEEARTNLVDMSFYTASEDETDSDPTITAIMTKVKVGRTVAVSHDLMHWLGRKIYIKGRGVFLVEDLMNARYTGRIDVLVASKAIARELGVQSNTKVVLLN